MRHFLVLSPHSSAPIGIASAMEIVETAADERRPLRLVAADRRSGLRNLDLRHLSLLHHRFGLSLGFGGAGAAASEQVGHLLAAALSDRAWARLLLQRLEG